MKIKFFKILLMILWIGSSSCEKYLDIKRTNTQSPISNANDLQLLLDNGLMNAGSPSDMNLSMDDFYVDSSAYFSDNVSGEDRDFYGWSGTAIRSSAGLQWQNTYNVIYNANLIVEYAEKFIKDGQSNTQLLNEERGAGLFYRAWGHWQIAQLFAKPFSSANANTELGIPLKLNSDINDKVSRGTLQQTYNQIVNDLKEAISLLPIKVTISSRPSKVAGYGMLARVLQSMEDYEQALSNANSALQIYNQLLDFNTLDTLSVAPFAIYNNEVIFHNITTNSSLLEPGTDSDPIAQINPELTAMYSSNDLRKKLFLKRNTNASKSYRFSGNYNESASSFLFNGLAVDELYLIRAESYARNGNISSAMADLNILLRTRWASGKYIDMTATSAEDALTKILVERRKELLMRGLRWTDLRRLNKDPRFATTLRRTLAGSIFTLPPNDSRYVLLIPNTVIQFGTVQNSR
ncbi:SusD family protein [Pedobacter westerhofensis]|uniref:SusD family protein n=1 Tax=Pedobacter westerhofensis TaxID=425512 RepID=A0A521FRN6_9SPHI|nr:RagB/SusD family nutrient uptake outer membrane protein [Pedobacter westerhofensis]SMO98858.1 SusD family protein [Pedobacter westerhofensis]